jgi:hypothetical protein
VKAPLKYVISKGLSVFISIRIQAGIFVGYAARLFTVLLVLLCRRLRLLGLRVNANSNYHMGLTLL